MAANDIINNEDMEVVGIQQWPDMTSMVNSYGPNTIHSHDNGGSDHYLLASSAEGLNDCRGNNIDISDTTRFLPSFVAYIFDQEKPPEKLFYEDGIAEIHNEDFESAKLTMRDIIDNYPQTETAEDALQWLIYLEKFSGQDYSSLRDYVEDINEGTYTNLERMKNKIIAYTYMFENDYATSISKFEDIIANPQSVQDSILAIINEGYCYTKLDETNGKVDIEKCSFKPKSDKEFVYVSQNLTQNLLNNSLNIPESDTLESEDLKFGLQQNYPNPTSVSTYISFTIPRNTQNASLKIYNIKGQMVRKLKISNETGSRSITWDGKNKNGREVASGIYFYKLTADKKETVKKMVVVK